MSLTRSPNLLLVAKEVARELRKNQTESEQKLWSALRNRRLAGKKFLRQHPILVEFCDRETFFVADFYCAEAKLIIELDGAIHDKQKDRDELRDQILSSFGYRLVRVKNEEVEYALETVLDRIRRSTHSPPHSPSLR